MKVKIQGRKRRTQIVTTPAWAMRDGDLVPVKPAPIPRIPPRLAAEVGRQNLNYVRPKKKKTLRPHFGERKTPAAALIEAMEQPKSLLAKFLGVFRRAFG